MAVFKLIPKAQVTDAPPSNPSNFQPFALTFYIGKTSLMKPRLDEHMIGNGLLDTCV